MALAAIDPWAADFESLDGEDDLRLAAIELFVGMVDKHPDLEVLRFVDGGFWGRYSEIASRMTDEDPRAGAQMMPIHAFSRVLGRFLCDDDGGEDRGSVTMSWILEVCRAIQPDNHPDWRDPVVFVPRHRRGAWPTVSEELEIVPKGVCRLLVTLEAPDETGLFVRDFDPWQCERARQTADDHADRELPRPTVCQGVRMDLWRGLLEGASDHVDASMTHLHFLPAQTWRPEDIVKADWRECPFGAHGDKILPRGGRKKGPEDRRGRVWAWDSATHRNHWDVQHESPHDDRYMNVFPNGSITKHYDD